ncbi:SEC-C metal-binding domain-containing protein [Planctomycetota bacterium]
MGLVLAMVLWRGLGLSEPCDRLLVRCTQFAVATLVPSKVEVVTPAKEPGGTPTRARYAAEIEVEDCLGASLEFNLFVPLLLFLFFPTRWCGAALVKVVLATLLVAVCDVLMGTGLRYWDCILDIEVLTGNAPESSLDVKRSDQAILALGASYYLVPAACAAASHYAVSRLQRLLARPSPPAAEPALEIARNDPCPCRSGRKFKRCCGARRRSAR